MNKKFLDIITSFKEKRLLIIGDIIVDRYIRGTVTEIAPDAPVPVVSQYSAEDYLGGALNIARCVRALHGQVCLCSVIGNDDEGKFVRDKSMKEWNMDIEGIFTVNNFHTTLNTRVTGNNQHMLRITRCIKRSVINDIQEQVKAFLINHRHNYDAIVIADYDKGFITPELIEFIVETFGNDIPIVARPIRKHFDYYNNVTAVILHRKTAEKLLQIPMINETSIRNSGLRILRMLNPKVVLMTWIEEGFHLFSQKGDVEFFPTIINKIPNILGYRDITYRDTVTSMFTLGLALNIDSTVNANLTLKTAEFYISRADMKPITYEELSNYLKTN